MTYDIATTKGYQNFGEEICRNELKTGKPRRKWKNRQKIKLMDTRIMLSPLDSVACVLRCCAPASCR